MLPRAAALLSLLLALPAGAEFYRWTDAAGREHFVKQLHQVPPEQRAQAEAARTRGPETGDAVSYHASSPRRTGTAGARAEAKRAAPAAAAPSGWSCTSLRREVREKQRVVARHRRSVESNRRWADDISKSAFSRRKYEARAEEEARWLAKAEEALEAFRDRNRRRGVPPGCLRD